LVSALSHFLATERPYLEPTAMRPPRSATVSCLVTGIPDPPERSSRPTRHRLRGARGPGQGRRAGGGGSLAAWLDEAGFVGQPDGLEAVAEVELGQYPPDMDLDGSLGQVHLAGDFAVGQPGGEPGEDGPFPVGEPAEQGMVVGLLAGGGE